MYVRVSVDMPRVDTAVPGVIVFHNEMRAKAAAVDALVVYKWSARYGNRLRWFRCRPNGVPFEEKPVDVVFWKGSSHPGGSLPTLSQLKDEYRKVYNKDVGIEYKSYETVVAEGYNLTPSDPRLERHARVSGQPYV